MEYLESLLLLTQLSDIYKRKTCQSYLPSDRCDSHFMKSLKMLGLVATRGGHLHMPCKTSRLQALYTTLYSASPMSRVRGFLASLFSCPMPGDHSQEYIYTLTKRNIFSLISYACEMLSNGIFLPRTFVEVFRMNVFPLHEPDGTGAPHSPSRSVHQLINRRSSARWVPVAASRHAGLCSVLSLTEIGCYCYPEGSSLDVKDHSGGQCVTHMNAWNMYPFCGITCIEPIRA